MAFVPFESEGGGSNISARSITPIFESAASGLQSLIPGMGPAPAVEASQEVAGDLDGLKVNTLTGEMRRTITQPMIDGQISGPDARKLLIKAGAQFG